MTTSMIERVARAIVNELGRQDGYDDPNWVDPDLKIRYLDQGEVDMGKVARAAIEAMREPADSMADEGYRSIHKGADAVWAVMIDKALES